MLTNKVIVITGALGLIGRSFVKALSDQNATVIMADIHNEHDQNINALIDLCPNQTIEYVQLDITQKESIQRCIQMLDRKFGRIDALINNAYPRNANYGRHFFDVEYDDFVENLGMNLGGYFLTSQQFAYYFKNQGYGKIINIASIYGVIAPKFKIYDNTSMTTPVEYAAIKSGLIHLTKYMAQYLKKSGIQINTISPGGIFNHQAESFLESYRTECSSKGMLAPEDLVGTLLFLLDDKNRYINGQNIIVDDGFTL